MAFKSKTKGVSSVGACVVENRALSVESGFYGHLGGGDKSLREQCFCGFCANTFGKGEIDHNGGKQTRNWGGEGLIQGIVSLWDGRRFGPKSFYVARGTLFPDWAGFPILFHVEQSGPGKNMLLRNGSLNGGG